MQVPLVQPERRRPTPPRWPLTVVDACDLTPRMRRVRLVGDSLSQFGFRPGQDLALTLPDGAGAAVRLHYTIRRFDPDELRLDIDVVLHGDSPGARWARSARLGDTLVAEGPRGRTFVRGEADWRLFTGDETALPAIAAMIEALGPHERAVAFIEVAGAEEEQPIETAARLDLMWLHRNAPPAAASPRLIGALDAFQLPPGVGQACVIGETGAVRAQRQGLIARGLDKAQIAAEGYWRPGRVGGHDHILDPEAAEGFGGRERRRA